MKKVLSAAALLAALQLATSCEIKEEFQGATLAQPGTSGASSAASLLDGVYSSMRSPFQGATQVFALSEVTTDERLMPTRGGDWDDNGKWRQLHLHNWDANHQEIRDAFNNLNGVVFAATDLLRYNPSAQQQAEARFLRAWAMYWILDLYDQVPYREPGEQVTQLARVRKGTEALDYVISEVNAVLTNLPDAPAYRANKDAARGLLMKCYLNRGVYANRAAPTFAAADMNQVISLADQIINTGRYRFATNYFDNFAPDNTNIGTENIFTELNVGGVSSGAQFDLWRFISHYNMLPSGYNGPTALSDFYDKFGANDIRRGTVYTYANGPTNPGKRQNVGFLIGQQYNLNTDAPLTDRSGAPLAFTREVRIIETDARTLERTGIRPMKYPPDFTNNSAGTTDNDMVHLRLPDVLLMKAEAILRGGTGTTAGAYGATPLALVNSIRTHPSRNAGALASVDLTTLYDERGRELYLEQWRRQDMVRFGTFLGPIQEGPTSSSPTYLIFPIPNQQLAVNTNLTQNPGY
ncbi:RagB/SusD family nutrient uptake outer membrane protein [Hymenobacter sp. HSC-4F20]|uniref:RagB/SusD family nutrient uptake outer membrane protein n=1 Tax=Hymenobacter sp. HSC-4F20 TaxID=2864135 RepID=UPI001C737031|nr:RagB/SusD family nutrient uptake outer membrane protein [Hymenobacter sp. HSC-4F20]MBX0290628.1 RagB/SusD family nutrient uptake outer membrane protein [Hymenobacter sp. HSC-4F20]